MPGAAEPRGRPVVLISTMGLEDSGLAVGPARYAAALRPQGWAAEAMVVGRGHPELGACTVLADICGLAAALENGHGRGLAVWLGLHTDDGALAGQFAAMRAHAQRGGRNVVLPERTGKTDDAAYAEFVAGARSDLGVVSLIHLNLIEASAWSHRLALPWAVAPVPVPLGHLQTGARRLSGAGNGRAESAVVFMGRLTARKGADRLLLAWPRWRAAAQRQGLAPALHVFGRFPEDDALAARLRQLANDPGAGVVWHPEMFDISTLARLPDRAVGLALSTQEFDGIAVSELLSLAVPVVATPASGHLALAAQTRAVRIATGDDDAGSQVLALLADDDARLRLGADGQAAMAAHRSAEPVGQALGAALLQVL